MSTDLIELGAHLVRIHEGVVQVALLEFRMPWEEGGVIVECFDCGFFRGGFCLWEKIDMDR